MKIKRMAKLPKIIGRVPLFYDREVMADTCIITNAQSDSINYLYEVVCEQQKEIDSLKAILAAVQEVQSESNN